MFRKRLRGGNDDVNTDVLGEKKFDKLIVMEDVSGLADKSNNFGSFLTFLRKFDYSFICLLHILYLSKFNQ